jgi:hypothetical protein
MKLIQITAQNLKGQSFTEDMTSLNFLIGSNFAGKTTRTDAIRLLLLGYLPELGKPAKDTFGLCSGTVLKVSGRFDNGMEIQRTWTAKGNTIKAEETIPDEFKNMGDLAVMMNAEEYFALGDRGRIEYVARLVNIGNEYTTQSIVQRLVDRLHGLNQASPPKLQDRLQACDGPNIQTVVEQMLKAMTDLHKEAKDYADRMDKTGQGLASLRTMDAQMRPLSVIEADIARLRNELTTLQHDRGTQTAAFETVTNARTRRAEITREMAKSSQAVAAVESINKTLAADRARLAGMPTPAPVNLQILRTAHMKATTERATAMANISTAKVTVARCAAEADQLAQHKNCPFCGATTTGWQEKVAADIAERRYAAEAIVEKNTQDAHQIDQEIAQIREKGEWAKKQAADYDALAGTITARERELASYQPMLGRQQSLADELERLPAENPTLDTAVQMLTTQINLKNQDLRKLESEQRDAGTRAGEINRLAKAEQERDGAKIEQKQAETCGKELKVIQAEMVEAAFRPILHTANHLFTGILKSDIAYHDGEIGTFRDGFWVAHHTFSGTEKLLTYAAIQAALTHKSPCRVMILDELGRLDDTNLEHLLVRLQRLTEEGSIDTVVGIDTGRLDLYNLAATPSTTVRTFE